MGYGIFARVCIAAVRLVKRYHGPDRAHLPTPAVYLCRHLDMRGPVLSISFLGLPARPWILATLCDRRLCYRHLCDYTLTERYRLPLWLAKIVAWPVAAFFSRVGKSLGAVPVHRDKGALTTFRLSLRVLEKGESILLYPDIDYASEEGGAGDLYEGFLYLDQPFFRLTGQHLRFIPLRLDHTGRRLLRGQVVQVQEGSNMAQERERVLEEIRRQL